MSDGVIYDIGRDMQLTNREVEILRAAAEGETAQDTADRLGISRFTVIAHRKSAATKLGALNITHAVAVALRGGII